MNRIEAKKLSERAVEAVKLAFANDPSLKGYMVAAKGGTIGAIDFTMKLQIMEKTPTTPVVSGSVSLQDIHNGYAPGGTKVVCGAREFTIIRARRSKYEIMDSHGKVFLARFNNLKLA